jgi:hypothetical protein
MTTYYVVMKLNDWTDLQLNYGPMVMGTVSTPDGSAHFLSVFENARRLGRKKEHESPY